MTVKVFQRVYDMSYFTVRLHYPDTFQGHICISTCMHAYISIRLGGLSDKDIQHIKSHTFTDEKIIKRSELLHKYVFRRSLICGLGSHIPALLFVPLIKSLSTNSANGVRESTEVKLNLY